MDEFAALYRENYQYVYSYMCSMLLNRDEAEDVVAEAFLKAAQAFGRFDPSRASFSTWVVTIARNCALSRKRKQAREVYLEDSGVDVTLQATEDDYPALDEDAQLAVSLMSILDEQDRELVHLKYYEDMSNSDIAALLGMNASTVGTRLSRAMSKMREAYRSRYSA